MLIVSITCALLMCTTIPQQTDNMLLLPSLWIVKVHFFATSCSISYLGRTPGLVAGASLLPVHGFGVTLCQRNCVSRTLNL